MGGKRKTNEQFLTELELKNPMVIAIDPYAGGHSKISFQCKKCGNRWFAEPVKILAGRGCPKCRGARISQSKTRSNDWFLGQMRLVNPSIEPLEKYSGNLTPIKCVCKTCNEEFNARPQVLLSGGRCPSCYKREMASKYRKSNNQFLAELRESNPSIDPLEAYQTASTSMRCRCSACGFEWVSTPSKLLRGAKCPNCNKGRLRKAPSRTITDGEFRAQVESVNPKVVPLETYVQKSKKMLFRCSLCGNTWEATPADILRGRGCPECGRERAAASRRKTDNQFVEELAEANPSVEPLEKYTSNKSKILCRCRSCGSVWKATPSNLLRGASCRSCGMKRAGMRRRKSHEDFVAELRTKNPDVEVLGKYKGNKERIPCKCRRCGREWLATPDNLLSGRGCRFCRDRETSKRMTKGHEQFSKELAKKRRDVELLGKYEDSKTPLLCKCKICGNTWCTAPSNLLAGRGCPQCASVSRAEKRTKSNDEFRQQLAELNPSIEALDKYEGSTKGIRVRCLSCEYEWIARPTNLLSGNGCPRCARSGTSFMELFLLGICKSAYGEDEVIWHDRSLIGMELDIYIPSARKAIEFGSWAWHKDKLDSDGDKRTLCAEQDISLLTIYDARPLDAPPFPGETCWVYSEDTGTAFGKRELREIGERVLHFLGQADASVDWDAVRREAKTFARRMSTSEFKRRVAEIDPDIEVLGEFTRQRERILCRCRRCGKEWSPYADSLLHGHGCKSCKLKKSWESADTNRHKRTPAEFREEVARLNPSVIVLGDFEGLKSRVLCKCEKCGLEWEAFPGDLLKGRGCKACGVKESAAKQRHTTEQFVGDMEKVDKNHQGSWGLRGLYHPDES
uniref:zinc-ribbon domain-containing protein n=1 Tax=Collinsella bouchesdurhonensis TaxID=1907654 RepID=UPI00359CBA0B